MALPNEELKLVESPSELSEGMLVVIKDCNYCSGKHRGILVRRVNLGKDPVDAQGWHYLPGGGHNFFTWFRDASVLRGKVWRVIDCQSNSEEDTNNKSIVRPKQLVYRW